MTERANQLHLTADRQIAELLGLVLTFDEEGGRQPCAGREKLGDGTVAAWARHTADNYQLIAAFVTGSERMSAGREPSLHGRHRAPRFSRFRGHGAPSQAESGSGTVLHDGPYTADNTNLAIVATELATTRKTVGRIAELTDTQLDEIPPKGAFRFCDGRRNLEQVIASALKHQAHQLDSLKASV
jgi:hypothetical protein